MAATSMINVQQSGGTWTLPPGAALRLPRSRLPRWVAVAEGQVWLTRTASDEGAPDVWLQAGERASIDPGVEVVVEGWPSARFALLEAATSGVPSRLEGLARVVLALLHRWRERAQLTPRTADCV